MIDYLKYLPRKTIIQLFNEVFDQLPEILAEVAPDGWEHSPYYPLFHFSPEQAALLAMLDKLITLQYRQRFGALKHDNSEVFDLKSMAKKFEFDYRPEPFHPEKELCSLFTDALSFISHRGNLYLEGSESFYEVNPPVAFSAAEIVARDKGIVTEKPFRLPMIHWEKRILIIEANLIPLMRYLFRALPNTDFKWEYIDDEIFGFIEYCDAYQAGDAEELEPYYATKRDHELGITSTPKLEDYFDRIDKELPSDAVVAYFDVFGTWPEGFPPVKEHYLERYEKIKARKKK